MTEAFISGGKETDSLFSRKQENILGGFAVTYAGLLVLPFFLNNIANHCDFISKILSPAASVKHLIATTDRMKKKEMKPLTQQETELCLKKYIQI